MGLEREVNTHFSLQVDIRMKITNTEGSFQYILATSKTDKLTNREPD